MWRWWRDVGFGDGSETKKNYEGSVKRWVIGVAKGETRSVHPKKQRGCTGENKGWVPETRRRRETVLVKGGLWEYEVKDGVNPERDESTMEESKWTEKFCWRDSGGGLAKKYQSQIRLFELDSRQTYRKPFRQLNMTKRERERSTTTSNYRCPVVSPLFLLTLLPIYHLTSPRLTLGVRTRLWVLLPDFVHNNNGNRNVSPINKQSTFVYKNDHTLSYHEPWINDKFFINNLLIL